MSLKRESFSRKRLAAGAAVILAIGFGATSVLTSSPAAPAASSGHAVGPGHTVLAHSTGDSDDVKGKNVSTFGSANICGSCKPPSVYAGGTVMGTQPTANGPVTVPGKITITPIYWSPEGQADYPTGYASTINSYISDIAHDSGKTTNVFGILPEYSALVNGKSTPLVYSMTAGPVITDTDAYPTTANQCTPDPTFTTCIPKAGVQSELQNVFAANKLTPSLGQLYVMFYPANVEIYENATSPSTGFCGGHQQEVNPAGQDVIYSDEPFSGQPGCFTDGNPHLNQDNVNDGTYPGYVDGDWAVSALSHEITEAITDPQINGSYGYFDDNGAELGDECSGQYGKTLGFTVPAYGDTGYNQVINGHNYYTQLGFSNKSFNSAGDGRGCIPGAFGSATGKPSVKANDDTGTPDGTTPDIGAVTVNSSDTTLPADGATTTTVAVTVTDTDGNPVAGDPVGFSVTNANQGEEDQAPINAPTFMSTGACGTITSPDPESPGSEFTTNADGQVFATYTASTYNGPCSITASEVTGGTSNETVIYQGSSDSAAPSLTQTVPTSLTAGGSTVTFSTDTENPGTQNVYNTTQKVYLSGDDSGDTGLDASDVTLSYADYGTNNQYVPITATGSTANGGYIEADLDPGAVVDYPAGASNPITFKLSLAKTAADSVVTGSPLTVDSEFDQLNQGSGAASNLAYDVGSTFVVPAASTSTTPAPIVVTTPASTVTTIYQPIQTIIMTVPGKAAAPAVCIAPNLLGKNVAQAQAALKKAHCTNTTLIVPKTSKGQKLVFSVESPTRSHHVSSGGNLKVTFRIVKPKK